MVSAELIQRFAHDGAVLLENCFTDWIEVLRRGVDEVMAAPSPLERSLRPAGSAAFFQDLCNWQRVPALRDFLEHSPAAELAATLMQSRRARFFHDHILVKEPGTTVATPWHQDLPYYCVAGPCSVSFWIPLDPVPRESCMECVAESHTWNRIHKPKRFDGTDLYAGDNRAEVPDIAVLRETERILGWTLRPGDAIAFHFATLHGAPATPHAVNRRRVFSARWVGDGSTFVDRHGRGSPPFKHLKLQDGDPFEGPDFPVLFERGPA